jgi:hypothetical protein
MAATTVKKYTRGKTTKSMEEELANGHWAAQQQWDWHRYGEEGRTKTGHGLTQSAQKAVSLLTCLMRNTQMFHGNRKRRLAIV